MALTVRISTCGPSPTAEMAQQIRPPDVVDDIFAAAERTFRTVIALCDTDTRSSMIPGGFESILHRQMACRSLRRRKPKISAIDAPVTPSIKNVLPTESQNEKKKIPEETQTTQRETLISGIFHEAAGRQVEPPDQNPPLKNAKWEPRRQKKFSAREKKTE